jgi:radical SAM superfamily enzyme YgiQ (UPF0313 family)
MARVIFLQQLAEEWLGVMYISSMLKSKGHSCDIYVEPLEREDIVKKAILEKPDIIAFSCLTSDYYWALNKSAVIRQHSKAIIIFGGTHVTLNPDIVISNPQLDIICQGEGEYPMIELANAIDKRQDYSKIKNLWIKINGTVVKNDLRNLIEELDSLPFPDRKLYAKYPFFKKRGKRPLHLSRGCPYNCPYCHNSRKKVIFKGKGKYVRWRNKESILKEIEDIKKHGFIKVLHFVDDSFGTNPQWLEDFIKSLSKMKGKKLTIQASMRADMVTEDLCEVFKEYGVQHLRMRFAIESGDENYRQKILKKSISNQTFKKVTNIFNKYKIEFITYNMIGLPGETITQALLTLKLNIQLKPVFAICFMFQPFPGTELADYALEKGFITQQVLNKIGTPGFEAMYHSKSPLKQKDIEKIENLHKIFSFVAKHPLFLPFARFIIKYRILFPALSAFYNFYIRKFSFQRRLRDKY